MIQKPGAVDLSQPMGNGIRQLSGSTGGEALGVRQLAAAFESRLNAH
jgi:hypothetical protein